MSDSIRSGFRQKLLRLNFEGFENLTFDQRRKILRDQIVERFLMEPPGTGTGNDSSRWVYAVESTCNDGVIYIQRPAALNKGMDFEVKATNISFAAHTKINPKRITDRPRHDSLYPPILHLKQQKSPAYKRLADLLRLHYLCMDTVEYETDNFDTLSKVFPYFSENKVKLEINCLTIARTIKWLLLEQDVTYWNWSGRAMYWGALTKKFGELRFEKDEII